MFKQLSLFLLLITPAFAQQTVITRPYVATTTDASSTITVTDNFQTVLVQNSNRTSCTIQNKGAGSMWVFFGPATSATKARSILLNSGQALSCIAGSIVLKDEVAMTGTAGDEFFAASQ